MCQKKTSSLLKSGRGVLMQFVTAIRMKLLDGDIFKIELMLIIL